MAVAASPAQAASACCHLCQQMQVTRQLATSCFYSSVLKTHAKLADAHVVRDQTPAGR